MTITPTGKEDAVATANTICGDSAIKEGLESPQKNLGADLGVNVALLQLSQEDCGITFGDRSPHGKGTQKFSVFENAQKTKTTGEAKKLGASLWDIKEWYRKGCLKLTSEILVNDKVSQLEKTKRLLQSPTR